MFIFRQDWVDEKTIADPEDTKPADWDVPETIADPQADKPEDWDDEMDGAWEPPQVANPAFKGEWKPKQIANPAYKGEWEHPQIDNPEYVNDPAVYKYSVCLLSHLFLPLLGLWHHRIRFVAGQGRHHLRQRPDHGQRG